ncbi:MAG: hypothetical protein NC037_01025 [Bacteroides sp.]|nr:hypothetical protein [Bacillota bacterium]MCM1393505.1 hypothetical protein [[Eubacterium] siraeum]MCM1455098.1 hypothetical protein [Bacteroides sp.]
MVGNTKQLSVGELGQALDLLTRYHDNLLYEAQEGALLDEHPCDVARREAAIEAVSKCIQVIADDLKYRLSNY